jgi:3-oxocholest-4-en-26-oate---CoA ligase
MPSSGSNGWNYADVWDAVAAKYGDAPALFHGAREVTWGEFDRHANGVAATLLAYGLERQDRVAQYMRNGPAYLESLYGAFKLGVVPVNTNYRYADVELRYLWTNSDSAAVVFDAEFTEMCARLQPELPRVKLWLRVGDAGTCPDWAVPYGPASESAAASVSASASGATGAPWARSGDDLYLLYTGGTTGMPKGVMWRQDDLFRMLEAGRGDWADGPVDAEVWVARLDHPGATVLPAPPLMHGTACFFCMPILSRGGAVVTLTKPSLDAVELLDAVAGHRVKQLCIVGDAFARPILRELDAAPQRWDLSRLRVVFSSGAMLSQDIKYRLLQHAPAARVFDGLGSSESGSLATSVTSTDDTTATAQFRLSPNTRVLDESGRDVVPGSGETGRLAVGGFLPLGYWGDPEKTAATFVQLGDRRYVIAGDWAEVNADGAITLLGRGSSCINTAGEKVFPEEVEEALKQDASVHDAAVVGIPDERFGERVVALVEAEPGTEIDEHALIEHVKEHLASYKAPRHVIMLASLERGPNGKLDHRRLRDIAVESIGT